MQFFEKKMVHVVIDMYFSLFLKYFEDFSYPEAITDSPFKQYYKIVANSVNINDLSITCSLMDIITCQQTQVQVIFPLQYLTALIKNKMALQCHT